MALYVSITLLAALAALPDDDPAGSGGVHGLALLGVIWGTTVGLALAHWFAFTVASRGVALGARRLADLELAAAQLGGAAVVALLTTIPAVLLSDDLDLEVSIWVPAAVLGVSGYFTGRAAGRSPLRSLFIGGGVLAFGALVALVKHLLTPH